MNRHITGALVLPPRAAAAPSYHLVARPLPTGFTANAVNVRGDVAGTWADPATGHHLAALIHDGILTVEPEQ